MVLSLRDAAEHPIPGASDTVTHGSGLLTTSRLLADTDTLTIDANGTLAFSVSSMSVGDVPVAATVAGTDVSTQVAFGPGSASGVMSTVSGGNVTLLADGTPRAVLVVLLRDEFGHPVSDALVNLASSWLDLTLTPSQGVTDVTGRLELVASGTKAGEALVRAALDQTSLWARLTMVAGQPSAATSRLLVAPHTVAADGVARASVTAVLRDVTGNAVPGGNVRLGASAAGFALRNPTGKADALGRYVIQLRGSVAAGTGLAVGECSYDSSQLTWTLSTTGHLQVVGTSLCLDATGAQPGSVAKLAICSSSSTAQQFVTW